jgi:release factor glutamine methyltransferase
MLAMNDIGSALADVAGALTAAGFDEARRRARRVVAVALGLSPAIVFGEPDRVLAEDERGRVAAVLRRVLAHEPLSRIQGVREFWGLQFALSPDTLDPRPDSETVVEAVLAQRPARERPYRVLDLGTGTGCLLLALLSEYPNATGTGVDRAPGAAAAARANALRLGFAARAAFVVGDWGGALAGGFDIVVTNPPYIASAAIGSLPLEVRNFDPRLALDGGADGLAAYRAIAGELPRLLAPNGVFACEVGVTQDSPVKGIISSAGLVVENAVPDLAGITRCVVARSPGEGEKRVGTAFRAA